MPSPDSGITGNVVWAVDDRHLPNYLVPRDCPRVAFQNSATTSEQDKKKFFSDSNYIIAMESAWRERIEKSRLFLYAFDPGAFECADSGAGYFVSRNSVTPKACVPVSDPLEELLARGVTVKFVENLWAIRDAVANSTAEFSIIRFRNASPRT